MQNSMLNYMKIYANGFGHNGLFSDSPKPFSANPKIRKSGIRKSGDILRNPTTIALANI